MCLLFVWVCFGRVRCQRISSVWILLLFLFVPGSCRVGDNPLLGSVIRSVVFISTPSLSLMSLYPHSHFVSPLNDDMHRHIENFGKKKIVSFFAPKGTVTSIAKDSRQLFQLPVLAISLRKICMSLLFRELTSYYQHDYMSISTGILAGTFYREYSLTSW